MNYGLYMAASGTLANMHRMDVLANNLANVETTGFKPTLASLRQRDAVRIEDGLPNLPSNAMLERLGAGVMMMPPRMRFEQGAPVRTSNPLDVTIEGTGFLVVQGEKGKSNEVRLTRDGRMTLTKGGELVLRSSGLPVLDDTNKPIQIDGDGAISIASDGQIRQGNRLVAKLQVATVSDQSRLRPTGDGLLSGPKTMLDRRQPSNATVISGALERSAVDPVKTMIDMSSAERAVGSTTRLIQMQDQMMDKAINTFGRVA